MLQICQYVAMIRGVFDQNDFASIWFNLRHVHKNAVIMGTWDAVACSVTPLSLLIPLIFGDLD